MTGNGNRGSAALPSRGRMTHDSVQAGAMPQNKTAATHADWHAHHWEAEQDEAAHRAKKLLTGPRSYVSGAFLYRLNDALRKLVGQVRSHRWAGRLISLMLI